MLQRLLILRAASDTLLEQLALPSFGPLHLRQLCLRRHEIRLRGAQCVNLVLRIEPCDQLAGGHTIADINKPLDELAIDTECEAHLVSCPDVSGKRRGFAEDSLFDDNRADGANLWSVRDRFFAGAQKKEKDNAIQHVLARMCSILRHKRTAQLTLLILGYPMGPGEVLRLLEKGLGCTVEIGRASCRERG